MSRRYRQLMRGKVLGTKECSKEIKKEIIKECNESKEEEQGEVWNKDS